MLDFITRLYQLLKREKILRLFIIIIVLVLIGSVGITCFEKDTTFSNAVWWSFVTLATVGYGDIAPVTWPGKTIGVFMMFFGIGLLGLFTATVASIFVDRKFKEERGMLEVQATNHFIICGWNHRASEIISSVRVDSQAKDKQIVLLADIEAKPIDDEAVFFIKGEVTEENLNKARVKEAETVVILLDERLDEYARDAKVILSTLTVESINPDVYTCVELVDSKNIAHCKRARANEIIVGEEFRSKLLTQAAINHGITLVISQILSKNKKDGDNDLYKIDVPEFLTGKSFVDGLALLKKSYDCLVMAVRSSSQSALITNPPADYTFQRGDQLIVISEKKVEF